MDSDGSATIIGSGNNSTRSDINATAGTPSDAVAGGPLTSFCFEGNVYWVLPQRERWANAMDRCGLAGAQLASFSSQAQQDTVLAGLFAPYFNDNAAAPAVLESPGEDIDATNEVTDSTSAAGPVTTMVSLPYPIWFGLLQVSGQTWAWAADGTEPRWESWGENSFADMSNSNDEIVPHECAAIWLDGRWRDRRCISSYRGLCMAAESSRAETMLPPPVYMQPPTPSAMAGPTSPDISNHPPPPPSLFCGLASRLESTICHGDKIFWLLKQQGTWNAARKACESQGGGLAVFTSMEQQQAVLSGLFGAANQLPYLMWIGINFQASSSMWVSGSGQPLGWTFWWGKRNGKCAIIGGECRWQQWPCSSSVRAICMGGTPSPPPLPPSPPPPPPPSPPPPSPPPPPCAMYGVCLDLTILPPFCQLPVRSRLSHYLGYTLDWTASQNQHFYNNTNRAIRRLASDFTGEASYEPFTSILTVDHGIGSLHGSHGCGGSGVYKRVRYEFLFPTEAQAQAFQTWLLWGNNHYEGIVDMLKAEDPGGVCAAESRVGSIYFPVNRCGTVAKCSGPGCFP